MILTDLEEKNSIKVSNSQNKWGLKSVVKNAFQATQADIAWNMPAHFITLLNEKAGKKVLLLPTKKDCSSIYIQIEEII